MRPSVKDQVLVHLIAQHEGLGIAEPFLQLSKVFSFQHRAAGVVGRIQDHHAGLRAQGLVEGLPVNPESRPLKGDRDRNAPVDFHIGLVAVVGRLEDDHFVPRAYRRGNGRKDGLGSPGRHRDLGVGVVGRPVEGFRFGRNGLPQREDARHGGVLVISRLQRFLVQAQQFGVYPEIREALGQVQGACLMGDAVHLAEDGGLKPGEFGGERQLQGFWFGLNVKKTPTSCRGFGRIYDTIRRVAFGAGPL